MIARAWMICTLSLFLPLEAGFFFSFLSFLSTETAGKAMTIRGMVYLHMPAPTCTVCRIFI